MTTTVYLEPKEYNHVTNSCVTLTKLGRRETHIFVLHLLGITLERALMLAVYVLKIPFKDIIVNTYVY